MTREQSRPMPKERLERLRRWSHLLDNVFRVPGTGLRFGWDSLLGLIPGLGDALTTVLSGTILIHAFRFQVPRVIQVRMLLNVAIDVLVGSVPVLGDAFDFAWKANAKNVELLERHALEERRAGVGDWVFVIGIILLLTLACTLPILAIALLLHALRASLS